MYNLSYDMHCLEIDITYLCTLNCYNCDRMLSIAPGSKNENMRIEQIEKLVEQSVDYNYIWKRIRIMGGEPTIHPQFRNILKILINYKNNYNKNLRLEVATNGYGKLTNNEIVWIKNNFPQIHIENTNKKDNYQKDFTLVNMAPCDNYKGNRKCTLGNCLDKKLNCGLGLNYSGFYCCAVGGAIDRIFGYNIGIKSIANITVERIQQMHLLLCPKCGHCLPVKFSGTEIKNVLSPTWEKALKSYKERSTYLDFF
ncbi:radical SAM protein [Ruminiclostridium herbifermentans]|uniref:Radical SAM protein n=1 Tax=Ruminiclostridium herbifermentans TaxID=2488810 RepID=A0A4U7JJU1_9FIRM|nr:radical SAM protein [Ruminiclostridium herbifermentans]QNU66223.1 radical SAM protein [Ruminiclostridium herbifermentans]